MDDPARRVRRVLIVDDEPDIRASLQDLLEVALPEVEVRTAEDAIAALLVLDEWKADVLVTDYRMPGMTGIDLIRAARETTPALAVVLITAYPDLDVAVRAINDGKVGSFLAKPLDPEALVRGVRDILAQLDAKHERERALARELNRRPR